MSLKTNIGFQRAIATWNMLHYQSRCNKSNTIHSNHRIRISRRAYHIYNIKQ